MFDILEDMPYNARVRSHNRDQKVDRQRLRNLWYRLNEKEAKRSEKWNASSQSF